MTTARQTMFPSISTHHDLGAMTIIFFILGLVFMIVGADLLVRGASRLAMMAGVAPLVVGLTVVAFGTSAPELAVSFKAALADQANICVGNVVGSNIFNVLFILGVSALVTPLIVAPQLIRLDLPLVIAVSFLTLLLGWDGGFGRVDGFILLAGLLAYVIRSVYASRMEALTPPPEDLTAIIAEPSGRSLVFRLTVNGTFIVIGLVLLVLGANWLVEAAVDFARRLQVSELVIGLTIVSAGTSLPEVVTSIVASIKGERDIAVGNVVGSNLFNIMGVLGLSAVVAPSGLATTTQLLTFDIPIMIAVAAIALPIFITGGIISRWEGGVLLGYYVAYTVYLVMQATDDPRREMFGNAMLYAVIPVTVLAMLVASIRWQLSRKQPAVS
jgi:cation:H+ antiporter